MSGIILYLPPAVLDAFLEVTDTGWYAAWVAVDPASALASVGVRAQTGEAAIGVETRPGALCDSAVDFTQRLGMAVVVGFAVGRRTTAPGQGEPGQCRYQG